MTRWLHSSRISVVRFAPQPQQSGTFRRARAFLLKSDTEHELINILFHARVLHIMKRNISAQDQPGVRHDVYELDYGCYAELKGTQRFPLGGLPFETEKGETTYIDVPPDDYRAIRRAILDISEFIRRPLSLDL